MQFLYPTSRQFPFDAACEQIVRALELRGWTVPGLVVEFCDYGSGAQKLRYVSSITSDQSAIDLGQHDVSIEFGRPQGRLPCGRWNDTAAVQEIRIARRSLRVYADDSGPTYEIYVGPDWERDRSTWWSRPNQRLNKEPRSSVKYRGRSLWRGVRAAMLTWDQDNREYGPEGDEPQSFCTADVMEEVRIFLHDVVLAAIEAYPVTGVLPLPAELPPIPMPTGVGPFFAYGEHTDARRIALGKKCLDELQLADRYGMSGRGYRLAPTGTRGDLPKLAFDGFLWCGTTPNVPGERGRGVATQLLKVTPKDARGVYVADHAAYDKRRAEIAATMESRDLFTQAEIDDFICARARTLVSISEYAGGYEDPVYLINRELGFDEVELLGERPS